MRWIFVSCVVVVAVGCPSLFADSTPEKNVLVLFSFSVREAFVELEPLKTTVRSRVSMPVNFYVEYLESERFGNAGYEKTLRETIRESYSGKQIDLVVVEAYPALRFALDDRDQLFPGVPIVFVSVAASRLQGGIPWPDVTGVTTNVDVRGSLDLALRLHPDTQNVGLVAGKTAFEQYWLGVIRDEVRQRQEKLKLIEIPTVSTKRLLGQVSELPSHTIVFFDLIPLESTQEEIGIYDVLATIARRFPTYCILDYCLGHGAIGGSYTDDRITGVKGGELAARVLSGEKPESIPVDRTSVTHPRVDWRELRRWNIPESALPPGTIVLYRQPTIWGQYRKYILAGVALFIFQTILIVLLLLQRTRRRAVTEDLKKVGGILIHAQDEERTKIARELHDDFSQRLAIQCIELTQLEKNLPESEIEERARAQRVLAETKEMSVDIRSLSHQLHSSRLELVGLVSALRGLCEDIAENYKLTVHLREPEFLPDLTKDLKLCLFRVTQEALANVVKHSQSSSVQVELAANANGLSLRISDQGKGFSPDSRHANGGIGLMSMKERLRLVGGRLSVHTELTRGTEVLAEIPLSASPKKAGGKTDAA